MLTVTEKSAGPDRVSTRRKLALVLFGPPGSGKGTQSRILVERLRIPQISTGDMLRDHIREGDAIGHEVEFEMKAGHLVSDDLVNQLVEERLRQPDTDRGFILDGYPRTRAQGQALVELLERNGAELVVIHLAVDYNEVIARISGRRQCPQCGTLYNLLSRPPQIPGICDLDGARLIVREDDREEVVRERLDEYDRRTSPLIEFFRRRSGRVYEVNATGVSPAAVSDEICRLLEGDSDGSCVGLTGT